MLKCFNYKNINNLNFKDMKKLFAICLLALGSMTAFSIYADDNSTQNCNQTEQCVPVCTTEQAPVSQVPCEQPINPAPCDTVCPPVNCNPAPCAPGC